MRGNRSFGCVSAAPRLPRLCARFLKIAEQLHHHHSGTTPVGGGCILSLVGDVNQSRARQEAAALAGRHGKAGFDTGAASVSPGPTLLDSWASRTAGTAVALEAMR